MIAGLCESPLTFQAIIIWRDELNEGKVLLRDIIDLERPIPVPTKPEGAEPETDGDGEEGGEAASGSAGRRFGRWPSRACR
jgi:RNA polymerase primary sigma factor